MDMNRRNVVVTGGAGALGAAVVGRLIGRGRGLPRPGHRRGRGGAVPPCGQRAGPSERRGRPRRMGRGGEVLFRHRGSVGLDPPRGRVRHGRDRGRPARHVRTPGLDERRDLLSVLPRRDRRCAGPGTAGASSTSRPGPGWSRVPAPAWRPMPPPRPRSPRSPRRWRRKSRARASGSTRSRLRSSIPLRTGPRCPTRITPPGRRPPRSPRPSPSSPRPTTRSGVRRRGGAVQVPV